MRVPLLLLSALLLASGAVLTAVDAQDQAGGPVVVLARIDGVITQGTLLYVEQALAEAEARRVPLVLEINTPGGLVDATLKIDLALANAEVPVLTFVGPRGGFAASAGVFIHLMGQPSGMAPGTTMGSAQPVSVGPGGGSQEAGEKVENFLVGRIREIAARTDRDPDVAARYITENLNLNGPQALQLGMTDVLADEVRGFLDAVHGQTARSAASEHTLDTRGARIVEITPGFLPRMVDILSNPQIAFVLVLAGTYALIFGLANPGSFVPETIGVILLVLGFIGLGLFSTSTAGVILLVLAVLFFVIEVFTPTNGLFTGAGVVALILAVLFLVDEPLLPGGFMRRFYFIGIATALGSGALVLGAVSLALRARKRPVFDSLRDRVAETIEPLDPEGRVSLHGEIWQAESVAGPIPAGVRVVVEGNQGLRLFVAPALPAGGPARQTEEE